VVKPGHPSAGSRRRDGNDTGVRPHAEDALAWTDVGKGNQLAA
jgi:hypothetical protein